MDFLKTLWPFKSKKKEYNESQWTTFGGYSSAVDERALLENNKEWVFIAVDKVSKGLSKVRFKVMKTVKGGEDTEVFEGPITDFLYRPATNLTGKQYLYLNTAYKELTGNSFWKIERIGKTVKLVPLISTCVTPIVKDGKLVGYKYVEGTATHIYKPEEVLHDRYVDPKRPYWGVGKLEKIARWVDTNAYAAEFQRLFYVNGSQFGGFIETEEESRDRIELIKAGLLNEHAGIRNAHKIAVLPKGSKFSAATATMAEMQYTENDDRMRDKILSAFGVPKTLVGFTTDVNRAAIEGSEYIFAQWTVKPIADELVDFMNEYIVPMFDNTGAYYIAYDDFVPENVELKIKERQAGLANQAYMSVNEVRATVGLPPISGGDAVYGNPFGAPLGTPEEAESEDEKQVNRPMRVRDAIAKENALDKIVNKIAEVGPTKFSKKNLEDDAVSHKRFVSRVSDHQKILANKIRDIGKKQEKEVQEKLGRITKAVSMSDLFDLESEIEIMIDGVSPLLKGLLIEQALDEFERQGFSGTFDSASERLKKIVEKAAKRLSKSYNHTTLTLLKQAINDGLKNGEGLRELSERVAQVYEFSEQYRAAMLAHTESFYIANMGSLEAYRQSGVVQTIRWYTSEDERVCEFCEPLNGEIIDIDESFYEEGQTVRGRDGGRLKLDYRGIDVPPLHPNCNCFVRAEEIEVQQL